MASTDKIIRVVLCDFDGTLIQGDLERMFMRYLLTQKEVRNKMLLVSCFTLPLNMLLNKLGWPSVMKSWTMVLGDNENKYIQDFLSQSEDHIQLKEEGWKRLLATNADKKVLLTGCYGNLIRAYLEYTDKASIFNEVIATEMRNRLIVKQHPYARGKMRFVENKYYNIGIANELSDHYYMDMCDEQYYV